MLNELGKLLLEFGGLEGNKATSKIWQVQGREGGRPDFCPSAGHREPYGGEKVCSIFVELEKEYAKGVKDCLLNTVTEVCGSKRRLRINEIAQHWQGLRERRAMSR